MLIKLLLESEQALETGCIHIMQTIIDGATYYSISTSTLQEFVMYFYDNLNYVPHTKMIIRKCVEYNNITRALNNELLEFRHYYNNFGLDEKFKLYSLPQSKLMAIINKHIPDISKYILHQKLPDWFMTTEEIEDRTAECVEEDSDYYVVKV